MRETILQIARPLLRASGIAIAATLMLHLAHTAFAQGNGVDLARDSIRKRDFAAAVSALAPLATAGNAEAQYLLAGLYRSGRGVDKDLTQSRFWMEQAATQGYQQAVRALEKTAGEQTVSDAYSAGALHWAARKGDLARVQQYLADGIPVDTTDEFGRTALMDAAEYGQADVVAILIDAGANPELTSNVGDTALLLAITRKQDAVVEMLLGHGAEPDHADKDGNTPLMYAAGADASQALKMLLERGADYRTRNADGRNAIEIAESRDASAAVAILKSYGAASTPPDQKRNAVAKKKPRRIEPVFENVTPMMAAVTRGDTTAIGDLLAAGASVDEFDRNRGESALTTALKSNEQAVAVLLIESGADPLLENSEGTSPLRLVASMGLDQALRALLKTESMSGTGFADKNSALTAAAQNGHAGSARLLLQHGADPNASNEIGTTALMASANGGHSDVLELLIDADASLNQKNRFGNTALIYAVQNGHTECVRLLLKAGADKRVRNNNLETATTLADKAGRDDIIRLLDS